MFGSCVGIETRPFGAAGLPFTPHAGRHADIAATAETRGYGRLALGVFYSRHDEDNIRPIGKMRHEHFSQREPAEVVRRERHVPAQRVLRRAHLHDARIVEQARDGQVQCDDFSGRMSHASDI